MHGKRSKKFLVLLAVLISAGAVGYRSPLPR